MHPNSETALAAQGGVTGMELVVEYVQNRHMTACEDMLRAQGVLIDDEGEGEGAEA